MKYIQLLCCCAYGTFLGLISILPLLLLLKIGPGPYSDIVQGVLAFCSVTVAQLFYVKTYKWLIYN